MKFQATVKTAQGFYDQTGEIKVKSGNLAGVTADLINELEYMPTEIDGVKLVDWTEITIVIRREV